MAILDEILNRKNAFSLVPDEEPIVPEVVKQTTAQENIESEQTSAQPETKYPNRPQSLTDSEYEHLLKYYSPDAINKFSAPFDPNSGESVIQRYYQSSIPAPSAPDEKVMRNRRIAAGVADGASMLAQLFAAGRGAHVRERDNFALDRVTDQEREEMNRFRDLSQRYNDGLFQARLKDFQQAWADYQAGRKGIQDVLTTKQRLDQLSGQHGDKMQYNYDKLASDQANEDREFEQKVKAQESLDRHRRSLEAQGWARTQDSRDRTAAYVKKMGSGSGGYQMIFPANERDADAQQDQFGNKLRTFQMSKGHIDQYVREALSDTNFLSRNPQFNREPGLLGEPPKAFTEKERVDIAAAYLQESYNQQFKEDLPSPSYDIPPVDWGYSGWEPELSEEDEEFPVVGNINF